jgi:hypothetical protein
MTFSYANGAMAALYSGLSFHSSTTAELSFENGYIQLKKKFHIPTSLTYWKNGDEQEQVIFTDETEGYGYHLEARHVMECLNAGKTESDLMPLSLSADLMEIMDRVRKEAGIVFEGHD